LQTAKDKFGRLNVAVNCAGILGSITAFTYDAEKDFVHTMDDFTEIVKVRFSASAFNILTLSAHCRRTWAVYNTEAAVKMIPSFYPYNSN